MKIFNGLLLSVVTMTLVACGGGSGNGGYTHSELARDFVAGLRYDLDYDVELVKTNTQQFDYIVVFDHDLNTYDAYDLSYYYAGQDLNSYFNQYEDFFFYDLNEFGSNSYIDPFTGIQFTKSVMTPADQVKAQEIEDGIKYKKATEQLTVQFGLSPKRAKEVAGLALQLNKADKSKMTTYQYDQYSKAVLGSTFSDIQGALEDKLSGNNSTLDKVYQKAAVTNNISKASVEKLADLFIKN